MNDKYYPLAVSSNIIHPKRIRFLSRKPEVRFTFLFIYVTSQTYLLQFKKVLDILRDIAKKAKRVQISKNDNIEGFVELFNKIIPNEYFGTRKHRKLFYRFIEKILTRSKHECIYVEWLAFGYDHTKIPWLTDRQKENKNASLFFIMIVSHCTYLYFIYFQSC